MKERIFKFILFINNDSTLLNHTHIISNSIILNGLVDSTHTKWINIKISTLNFMGLKKYIFYINILTRLKMYALKNYENNLSIINNNGNNDKNNYLMITKLF